MHDGKDLVQFAGLGVLGIQGDYQDSCPLGDLALRRLFQNIPTVDDEMLIGLAVVHAENDLRTRKSTAWINRSIQLRVDLAVMRVNEQP